MDYILLLLVCGNFPLTLNIWKVIGFLELYLDRIPYIYLSNKWNWITIYIYNYNISMCILLPAYNRCKITIQLLWCSNFKPYKTLSRTSYTMKFIQPQATYTSFMLWTFHESGGPIYFSLHPSLTRAHHHNGTCTKLSNFQICIFYNFFPTYLLNNIFFKLI